MLLDAGSDRQHSDPNAVTEKNWISMRSDMQLGKVLLTLYGLLLWGQADALYGRKSAVQVLDSKNFDKVVLQQDVAAIVEFFAPW